MAGWKRYILLGERQLDRIGTEADARIQSWARRWFGDRLHVSRERKAYQRKPGVPDIDWWGNGDECFALDTTGLRTLAARLLFPHVEPDRSRVVSYVVERAIDDLVEAFLDAKKGEPDSDDEMVAIPYRFGEKQKEVLLSKSVALRLSANAVPGDQTVQLTPMNDRRDGIGSARVSVSVYVGGAEISLKDVSTLRKGDVLVLDRLVSDSCEVKFDGTGLDGNGRIGRKGGRRAVWIESMNMGDG